MNEKIDSIKKRITTDKTFNISRIPPATLRRFLELANYDDFCSDRGMVLKYLIDFHDGLIRTGVEHIEERLDMLDAEITMLKKEKEEKPKPKRSRG